MTTASRTPSFVLKYYLYAATLSLGFIYPITTQYQLWRGLTYSEVGTVGAVFMGTWVLSEIPTGYLGDRFGRRRLLIASCALNATVVFSLAWATTFEAFVVATFGWAVAISMRSGVGSAWLYDLLQERLDEDEYARVRGNGLAVMLAFTAVASVVGGYLAKLDFTYPYLVNAAWVAGGILVLLTLPSSDEFGDAEVEVDVVSPREAASTIRAVVTRPPLRSFVLYFAAFFAFVELVDLYVQPVATDVGLSRSQLGLLYAGFCVVAAAISVNAGRIKERIGVRGWFLTAPFVVGVAFVAIAFLPVLAIPAFFLVKAANRTSSPLMQQYVNDHVGSAGRATGVSAVTMVGGVAAVGSRTAGGVVADVVGPAAMLSLFAAGLIVVLATVALFESPVPVQHATSEPVDSVASDD